MTRSTSPGDPRSAARIAGSGAAIAAVLLARFLFLADFPPLDPDEGGWPYSVRQWSEQGTLTYDFYTAPGFHVALGAAFRIFEPVVAVARAFSALCGLLSLTLFAVWTRRLLPAHDARWAVLLLGTLAPVVIVDRRALIEPLALVFVHGALVCLTARSRWLLGGLVLTSAGALLTKANSGAVFLALVAGLLLDRSGEARSARVSRLLALTAGGTLAVLVYLWLYTLDPSTFRLGWGLTLVKPMIVTESGLPRAGRFGLNPGLVAETLVSIGLMAPFLVAAGLAGSVAALSRRQLLPVAVWGITGIPFVLVQLWQSGQYLAPAYPPLVVLAVWLTSGRAPLPEPLRRPAHAVRWLVLAWSVAVLIRGFSFRRDPATEAVRWLREHRAPGEKILAPPFIIMQFPPPGIPHFVLRPDLLPDPGRLADSAVTWIVVDRGEWTDRLRAAGLDSTSVESAFRRCCELRFSSLGVQVYAVRGAEGQGRDQQ